MMVESFEWPLPAFVPEPSGQAAGILSRLVDRHGVAGCSQIEGR